MVFESGGKEESTDFTTEGEGGKWVLGKEFGQLKIMKFLAQADEEELVATLGSRNLGEELYNVANNMPIDALKLRGLRRLINTLSLIISNTHFALKKNGKEQVEVFNKKLGEIKKLVNKEGILYSQKINQIRGTSTLTLNQEEYEKILEIVRHIKQGLNTPLYDAGLIYINVKEFDSKAYKDSIKRRAIEEG